MLEQKWKLSFVDSKIGLMLKKELLIKPYLWGAYKEQFNQWLSDQDINALYNETNPVMF